MGYHAFSHGLTPELSGLLFGDALGHAQAMCRQQSEVLDADRGC